MRSKICAFIIGVCLSLTVYGQKIATLYYNDSWELTTKDASAYYRICIIDTVNYHYWGQVKDFTKSGALVMQGVYKMGSKEGHFTFYYPSGLMESQGEFLNNTRNGLWKYYHKNGNVQREVVFTANDFIVHQVYDSIGNTVIKEGTGLWEYEYEWYKTPGKLIVSGALKNGKKEGEWICKMDKGDLLYKEKFNEGEFKKGTLFEPGGAKTEYTEEFQNKFLQPYKLEVTENFLHTRLITKADYPFFNFLPNPIAISDDSVEYNGEIFLVVEESAHPAGGMQAFYEFVASNIRYPAEARKMGVEGKVFVEFVVNRDGSITDVKALKGIGGGCDQEAVRVITIAPNWNPGTQRGKAVRQRMVLPITFRLDSARNIRKKN